MNRTGTRMLSRQRLPEVRPLTLRHNFVWSLLGSVGNAASQWAIIVLLAKLGTPAMVGAYAFALAITAPVLLFTQLNLRLVQAVDGKGEYRFSDYFAVRLAGSVAGLAAIGLYACLTRHEATTLQVILLLALGKTIDGICDVAHGLFQRRERMDRQAQSLLLRGMLQLVGMWSALVLTGSVIWGAVALAFASLLVGLIYDLPCARWMLSGSRVGGAAHRAAVRVALVRAALPLGLMAVLGSLYQNIPRYSIESLMGVEAVGFFSAIFYLTYVGFTIVSALGSAFAPRLAIYYTQNRIRFGRYTFGLTLIGASVGAIGTLVAFAIGPSLLTLLYRPEYAEYQYQMTLRWVMISSAIWYAATMLSFSAVAAKQFGPQAYLHALAAITTWLLCPMLLDSYGLAGAAMALTGGLIVLLLGEVLVVWTSIGGARRPPSAYETAVEQAESSKASVDPGTA